MKYPKLFPIIPTVVAAATGLAATKNFLLGESDGLISSASKYPLLFNFLVYFLFLLFGAFLYWLTQQIILSNETIRSKFIFFENSNWYAYYSSAYILDPQIGDVKCGIARSIVRFKKNNKVEVLNSRVSTNEVLDYQGTYTIEKRAPNILKAQLGLKNTNHRDLRYQVYIAEGNGEANIGIWTNIDHSGELFAGKMILIKTSDSNPTSIFIKNEELDENDIIPNEVRNFFKLGSNQIKTHAVAPTLNSLKNYNKTPHLDLKYDIN